MPAVFPTPRFGSEVRATVRLALPLVLGHCPPA
jgi:hypothetical protein